jgi:hypothetical protein
MDLLPAGALATTISYVVFTMIAVWYVVPWLRANGRAAALTALVWVQAFRYVALQIFSAQRFGFAVSDGTRDQIAYGDIVGMVLAVAAILALRYRARISIPLIWLLVVETVADLLNATIAGVREQVFAAAANLTWMILTFYVPLLWVSLALIVWQLYARRHEPLAPASR